MGNFREVKVIGGADALTGLNCDFLLGDILIKYREEKIVVRYTKRYFDSNGDVFKEQDLSYTVSDPSEITAWDANVGAMFKAAIENQISTRNGLV